MMGAVQSTHFSQPFVMDVYDRPNVSQIGLNPPTLHRRSAYALSTSKAARLLPPAFDPIRLRYFADPFSIAPLTQGCSVLPYSWVFLLCLRHCHRIYPKCDRRAECPRGFSRFTSPFGTNALTLTLTTQQSASYAQAFSILPESPRQLLGRSLSISVTIERCSLTPQPFIKIPSKLLFRTECWALKDALPTIVHNLGSRWPESRAENSFLGGKIDAGRAFGFLTSEFVIPSKLASTEIMASMDSFVMAEEQGTVVP
jgi:hypothetical protein